MARATGAGVVVLAGLLGACASSTTPDTGRGMDAGPGVDAASWDAGAPVDGPEGMPDRPLIGPSCGDVRCAVWEACVEGACQPYDSCVADSMCGADEICRNRFCVPRGVDVDGDGVPVEDDCDEADPGRHPGATEVCDGRDQDCDAEIDEGVTRACSTACGAGTERCVGGAFTGCDAPAVGTESCDNTDEDCDGSVDEGLSRPCSTACGAGTESCAAGAWVMCDAPPVVAETCDLVDDDCDGSCDESVSGCRVGVHRSSSSATGEHFYTASRAEAACCGFTVESYDFYRLYAGSQPGLVPFYRCLLSSGFHFYTRSATCEGAPGSSMEGILGHIATAAGVCGSVPLYRLVRGNDHFFTVSAGERDSAITGGYVSEGVAGYVWTSP